MSQPATIRDLRQSEERARALVALRLAFIAAAPGILTGVLGSTLSMPLTRQLQVALSLPAAVLGIGAWCEGRSFARSAPVVACVLVSWIGFLYASPKWSEGLEFIAQVTILLPVAALIVQTGAWMMCAKTFIYANAPVLAYLFWIEYQRYGLSLFLGMHRFGCIYTEELDQVIANPNSVGGQLAFVAVLSLALFLRAGKARPPGGGPPPKGVGIGWALVYATFCLLTASRGAFTALSAATATLILGSLRSQRASRYRDLLAFSIVAAALVTTLASIGVFTPWELLTERWERTENVAGLGNRATIWHDAYRAWRADPVRSVVGAGTGAASVVLGQFNAESVVNKEGHLVRDTHSAYVEWGLSFGLLGLAPGICLLAAMARRALAMDRRDGTLTRTAILICAAFWAAVSSIHRHPSSLATGSLILAMLSDPPRSCRPQPPAARRQDATGRPT